MPTRSLESIFGKVHLGCVHYYLSWLRQLQYMIRQLLSWMRPLLSLMIQSLYLGCVNYLMVAFITILVASITWLISSTFFTTPKAFVHFYIGARHTNIHRSGQKILCGQNSCSYSLCAEHRISCLHYFFY